MKYQCLLCLEIQLLCRHMESSCVWSLSEWRCRDMVTISAEILKASLTKTVASTNISPFNILGATSLGYSSAISLPWIPECRVMFTSFVWITVYVDSVSNPEAWQKCDGGRHLRVRRIIRLRKCQRGDIARFVTVVISSCLAVSATVNRPLITADAIPCSISSSVIVGVGKASIVTPYNSIAVDMYIHPIKLLLSFMRPSIWPQRHASQLNFE